MNSSTLSVIPSPFIAKADEDGRLALHLFCQNRKACVKECAKLLASNPSAASKHDVYGRTPLFYTLKRACPDEIIRLVFEAYPEAVTQRDFCGITPIYLVYHGSKPCSILKSMLEFAPWLALRRMNSFSAPDLMRLVCAPWENLTGKNADNVRNDAELSNQWEKLVLTIRAAYKCRHGREAPVQELHVAVGLPCSMKVLSWFIQLYPDQLRIPMEHNDGMLPLHSFITSREFCNRQGSDGILSRLLELYPESARIPWRQQLPLHLAIQSGCSWTVGGLQRLLYAYPAARHVVDIKSSLLPCMMDHSDLSTRYSLLREGPEVLLH